MIRLDSRLCEPGDCFAGPDVYAPDAQSRGAMHMRTDLLTATQQHRQALRGIVIAVVGSFAKTTTKDQLAHALSAYYTVHATHHNQNNELGVPLTLLNARYDDAFVLVEAGIRKPDDMAYLQPLIQPDWVILTGFGPVHREFFDSDEAIAIEKLRILSNRTQRLWVPRSIRFANRVASTAKQHGIACMWLSDLSALIPAISLYLGKPLRTQSVYASPHRLKLYDGNGIRVLDDSYNANPDAVLYALSYAKYYSQGPLVLVLGDMQELGPDALKYHEMIIRHLETQSPALVILVGPLYKAAHDRLACRYQWASNAIEALALLREYLYHHNYMRPQLINATVLIKGSRCMQLDQIVSDLIGPVV